MPPAGYPAFLQYLQSGRVSNFMRAEGRSIKAIVLAGVGSSVLGTAALARNVADYTGWDVAGIVTGYGMSDVVLEGLGGWFYYGGIDRLQFTVDQLVGRTFGPQAPVALTQSTAAPPEGREHVATSPSSRLGFSPFGSRGGVPGAGYPAGSFDVLEDSDVRTLYDVLCDVFCLSLPVEKRPTEPRNLQLLVGHSKGNLLISHALNYIRDELSGEPDVASLFKALKVVTLGAVVDIPGQELGLKTFQFLGQLDGLGLLNSDRDPPFVGSITIPHEVVPGVGHHLNPFFSCNMSVSQVFSGIPEIPKKDGPPADGAPMFVSPMGPWNWLPRLNPVLQAQSIYNYSLRH